MRINPNNSKKKNGRVQIYFTLAYNLTLNHPSRTPHGAIALVENDKNEVIIIKESKSTTQHYAKQDIGYTLHSPMFGQHYGISCNQYNDLFGKGNWDKTWMDKEEFSQWIDGRTILRDEDADKRQDASWKSTGHK